MHRTDSLSICLNLVHRKHTNYFSKTIHFNKKNSDAPLPVALSHNYWTCQRHYSAGTGLAHRYILNSSSCEAVSRGLSPWAGA